MNTGTFEIVPIEQAPLDQVLNVLDQSLGSGHTPGWFQWKHGQNPFGPSLGWVAMNPQQQVLGVRLFMRWVLQSNGHKVMAVRPVDTATAPAARGQGVFRTLTEFAVTALAQYPEIKFLFNTPNTNSRPGYARMGWHILPPIAHGIQPVIPGRTDVTQQDNAALAAFDATDASDRFRTVLNREYLHWRYAANPNVAYKWARLTQADASNGIVYRVVKQRLVRLLIVTELIGSPRDRTRLVRSVAQRGRVHGILVSTGVGANRLIRGPLLHRGKSVLAVRLLGDCRPNPLALSAWALTLGDLEGSI